MAGWGHSGINPKLQISSVFPYQWPWTSQTSHRFASSFCQLHPSALVLSCQSWDKENHRDYIKAETWQVTDMQQKTSETISSWLQIVYFSLNLGNCTETGCSALHYCRGSWVALANGPCLLFPAVEPSCHTFSRNSFASWSPKYP